MREIKFLFDLGNVFFDWDPKYYYKDLFENSNEMEYFFLKICNEQWNLKQDAGRAIKKAENELIKLFPNYKNLIKLYYKNHAKMIKGIFPKPLNLLYNLKNRGYKCYVLSNWSSETFIGTKKKYKFLNDFDGIIISGDVRLVKPDPKIYKLACRKFNLIPEKTIFIDDKIENIKAASKLMFKTIHLTNPKDIAVLVKEKLLLIN